MTVPARQCACFILILGCISVVPLAASADQASRLEEVIVTATKRESSLMETSASISAFDSSMLDRLGIGDSQDLVAHTPSLPLYYSLHGEYSRRRAAEPGRGLRAGHWHLLGRRL